MTKQKYTDYRERNPLYRCVDCNSSRNSTAGEKSGTCYDCGGKMSTAGDRTQELDKEHAVDREWHRRGVCFDPGAEPYPSIVWTTVNDPRLRHDHVASRAAVADIAAIEKREQRLREYGGRATFNDDRYSCENCGSSRKVTFTTFCANCGGLMKTVAPRPARARDVRPILDTNLDTAIGSDLDAIGQLYKSHRCLGESDQSYRRWLSDLKLSGRAPVERREQRLEEYRPYGTTQCTQYRCEWCGSVARIKYTTVCSDCGGLMKLI